MSCDIITIYNPFMSYMKDIDKSIKIFILPYFEGQYYLLHAITAITHPFLKPWKCQCRSVKYMSLNLCLLMHLKLKQV